MLIHKPFFDALGGHFDAGIPSKRGTVSFPLHADWNSVYERMILTRCLIPAPARRWLCAGKLVMQPSPSTKMTEVCRIWNAVSDSEMDGKINSKFGLGTGHNPDRLKLAVMTFRETGDMIKSLAR